MSNNSQQASLLDVIHILRDGVEFYSEAKAQVNDENMKLVFNKMIRERWSAIAILSTSLTQKSAKEAYSSDIIVEIRKMYLKAKSVVATSKDHTYIEQLEDIEDETLKVFDRTMRSHPDAPFIIDMRPIRATMRQCRDEMKALHNATA